ncbi:MAG: hypothetical protein ABS68_10385 [Niastella sp. SCN 39-18]|nr:hypothetical protein [Sphingobacteriales bacterium]ODT52101.1 MAG: hypothetical protein ABS68_10385 [Niastella sp. SCN 39-18]OJW11061.1 MAG: hypothetical protein BGO53_01735 [Sphingobacteriales bacterium 39-19]
MGNKKSFIIGCLLLNTALAQTRPADTIEYVQDPAIPRENTDHFQHKISDVADTVLYSHLILINRDSLARIKQKTTYKYAQNLDSLLRAWKRSAEAGPESSRRLSLFERFMNSGLVQILMWSMAILFVLYLLYRFFLTGAVFRPHTSKPPEQEFPGDEGILSAADYSSLIDKCLVAGNYRLATRYYFLKILQHLHERQHIHFSTEKTNAAYLSEMPVPLQPEFSTIALHYEYVWYGNKPIDKNSFLEIENTCKRFISRL